MGQSSQVSPLLSQWFVAAVPRQWRNPPRSRSWFRGNGVSSASLSIQSPVKRSWACHLRPVQKQRPRKSDSVIKGKDGQKPGRKRSVMVSGKVPKFKHLQIGKVKPKTAQMYEAAVQKFEEMRKVVFAKIISLWILACLSTFSTLCESRCITDASYAV